MPKAKPASTQHLIEAASELRRAVSGLKFGPPIACVYNPLEYAWPAHETYLRSYGAGQKRVAFLGMNPGPFGMAQTGVPFGEIAAVRDWLRIHVSLGAPSVQHPRRPITGFACARSEVSGRRLWGLFATRFGSPQNFFAEHLVINYCPLAFVEQSGRNLTPDKLRAQEKLRLFAACDEHLRAAIRVLQPEWLVAIGEFAFQRATEVFVSDRVKLGRILHPSPANPAANRNWEQTVTRQLVELGVWPERR